MPKLLFRDSNRRKKIDDSFVECSTEQIELNYNFEGVRTLLLSLSCAGFYFRSLTSIVRIFSD